MFVDAASSSNKVAVNFLNRSWGGQRLRDISNEMMRKELIFFWWHSRSGVLRLERHLWERRGLKYHVMGSGKMNSRVSISFFVNTKRTLSKTTRFCAFMSGIIFSEIRLSRKKLFYKFRKWRELKSQSVKTRQIQDSPCHRQFIKLYSKGQKIQPAENESSYDTESEKLADFEGNYYWLRWDLTSLY